ncbi:unnamed protein product [Moneuplotes crassus]|uniref:Uncharacterized protein n=1 Tax=Euplotes crassus TaxID=5936 RepID=A0AAD1XRZ8_EUPCR|nr:unnamed protein product [Moneuplotes crassus]
MPAQIKGLSFPKKILKRLKREATLLPFVNTPSDPTGMKRLDVPLRSMKTKAIRCPSNSFEMSSQAHSNRGIPKNISNYITKRMKKEGYLNSEISEASKKATGGSDRGSPYKKNVSTKYVGNLSNNVLDTPNIKLSIALNVQEEKDKNASRNPVDQSLDSRLKTPSSTVLYQPRLSYDFSSLNTDLKKSIDNQNRTVFVENNSESYQTSSYSGYPKSSISNPDPIPPPKITKSTSPKSPIPKSPLAPTTPLPNPITKHNSRLQNLSTLPKIPLAVLQSSYVRKSTALPSGPTASLQGALKTPGQESHRTPRLGPEQGHIFESLVRPRLGFVKEMLVMVRKKVKFQGKKEVLRLSKGRVKRFVVRRATLDKNTHAVGVMSECIRKIKEGSFGVAELDLLKGQKRLKNTALLKYVSGLMRLVHKPLNKLQIFKIEKSLSIIESHLSNNSHQRNSSLPTPKIHTKRYKSSSLYSKIATYSVSRPRELQKANYKKIKLPSIKH